MKRYIRASSNISDVVLQQAIDFAQGCNRADIDVANRKLVIPFSSDSTEEELMSDGMLGRWYADNGFNVSFTKGDFAYNTKSTFNSRSMTRYSGKPAYLRNRLIMTITW